MSASLRSQIDVVLFERKRHVASVPRGPVGGRQNYEPLDGSWDVAKAPSKDAWEALPWPRPPLPWYPASAGDAPMVTSRLVHTAVADRWVAHSSSGTDERRLDHKMMGYAFECKLTRAGEPRGVGGRRWRRVRQSRPRSALLLQLRLRPPRAWPAFRRGSRQWCSGRRS